MYRFSGMWVIKHTYTHTHTPLRIWYNSLHIHELMKIVSCESMPPTIGVGVLCLVCEMRSVSSLPPVFNILAFGWNCLLCCINRITMGKRIEKTVCHLHIWTQLRLRIPKMSIFTAKDEYFVKCKNIHLHFLHDKFDIFERNMSRNIPYAPGRRSRRNFVNLINISVIMSKSKIRFLNTWSYCNFIFILWHFTFY